MGDKVVLIMGQTNTSPNPIQTNMTSSISVVLGALRSEQVANTLPSRAAIHCAANNTLA